MLLRLSRISFCLAASAAALALVAPAGHEAMLAAFSSFSGLFALGLWRSAAKQAAGDLALAAEAPPPCVVEAPALLDAIASLRRRVQDAPDADAALHAAAAVLRGELGAARARVHAVDEVRCDHAILRDLVEFEPGFRTVPRSLRLSGTAAGVALRSGRATGNAPGDAAVPVLGNGRVVALIVLEGIGLRIEAGALANLLEQARAMLSQAIQATPVAAAVTPPAIPVTSRGVQHHPNVLVVQDKAVQPESTARMLARLGCRVTTASGMLDGWKCLRETQLDLILVDLQSFGTDAPAGLARWRRDACEVGSEGARDAPAIALSGLSMPGNWERLRELGFDDHLCKPFGQAQLLDMLNRHLPRETQAEAPDGSARAPAPQLDPAALARLTELDPTGQNQLVARVMQAFQTSVARLRPQLDAARESGERATIKLVAHTLKSSSASIGALRLSALCADVETMIRLEPQADLGPRLDALNEALDSTLAAIDALLEGQT